MPVIEEVFDATEVLDRFGSSKARSEEEERELLKAVAIRFSVDEDSKWSRMTDEYNERAVEKKSKQWIKRTAAKLDIKSNGVSASDVSEQTSNRSKKKQAAVDAANAEAARRVAQDMPEDADGQAAFRRAELCDVFWDCIQAGDHMDESAEGIFGCKMGDSVGDRVHGTWRLLWQRNLVSREQVENSLADGTLPASFMRWLASIPASEHNSHSLSLASSPETLSKIPWNISGLKLCAKPGTQITLSADAETLKKQSKISMEDCLRASSEDCLRAMMGDYSSHEDHGKAIAAAFLHDTASKRNDESSKRTTSTKGGTSPSKDEPIKTIGDYTWVQTADELEISIYVGAGVTKKDVSISFKTREVCITRPCKLQLELHAPINVDGCNWILSSDDLIVTLEKKLAGGQWPNLLKQ